MSNSSVTNMEDKVTGTNQPSTELGRLVSSMGLLVVLFVSSRVLASLATLALSRFLPVDDFGYLVLARNLIDFGYVLLNLGLPFAFVRYFSEYRDRSQSLYRTTGLAVVALNLTGSALVLSFRSPLTRILGMNSQFERYLLIVGGIFLLQALGQLVLLDHQAREDFRGFVKAQLFLTTLTLVPMSVVGGFYRSGDKALLGLLAGNITAVPVLIRLFGNRYTSGGEFDAKLLKRMLSFGIPLVFTNVAFWLVSFSDRFIIGYFRGIHDVSIYALPGLLCSLLVMIFTMPVNSALGPQIYRLHEAGNEREIRVLLDTINKVYQFLVPASLILLVNAAPMIISMLGRPEYEEGLKALPVLGAGTVFFVLYSIPNVILSQHHRTKAIGAVFIVSSAINVGLNSVLVPRIGFMGAAWSALASYFVIYVVTTLLATQHFQMAKSTWMVLPLWLALFYIQERVVLMGRPPLWAASFGMVLLIAYALAFLGARIIRASELRLLWMSIRR